MTAALPLPLELAGCFSHRGPTFWLLLMVLVTFAHAGGECTHASHEPRATSLVSYIMALGGSWEWPTAAADGLRLRVELGRRRTWPQLVLRQAAHLGELSHAPSPALLRSAPARYK